MTRLKRRMERFLALAVATLVVPFVVLVPASASEHESTTDWSWSSADVNGSLAVRLTLHFDGPTTCTITFATYGAVLGVQEELFMGRDDDEIPFLAASMSGESAIGAAWNLPGKTEVDGIRLVGDQRGLRVTNTAPHAGTEAWLFIGLGLGLDPDAPTDAAFDLDVQCLEPYRVEPEVGREVAPFGPGAICTDREALGVGIYGCPFAASAEDSDTWSLTSPRGIMRYHQFSFQFDAGRVTLHGPGEEEEMVYHSSAFTSAPPGVRLESGPGTYGYTLTHAGIVPYVATGWAVGVHPVSDLDQWRDLPTLRH